MLVPTALGKQYTYWQTFSMTFQLMTPQIIYSIKSVSFET